MTLDRDSYAEMHCLPLGDDVAERLISGHVKPTDAPDSHAAVAALFEAATAPATSAEVAHKSLVVAAGVAEVRSSIPSTQQTIPGRKPMRSKILTVKVGAAATIAALGVGTAAAAATGSLPGQTSNANSHASSGLTTASSHLSSSPSNSRASSTGVANSHAQFGLCTAFLAADKDSGSSPKPPPQYSSTAFRTLISQHGGSIAATTTYCHGVVGSKATTSNANKPSGGASTDAGKPSSAASSNSHAPVATPNSGGVGTANSGSDGASSGGTSTGNSHSNGASSAGSGNVTIHH